MPGMAIRGESLRHQGCFCGCLTAGNDREVGVVSQLTTALTRFHWTPFRMYRGLD